MTEQPRRVALVIADISGYTNFMVSSKAALSHAQAIITELIEAIVHEIRIPLRIAEIEGDAVFFYGVEEPGGQPWQEVVCQTHDKLLDFFRAFYQRLNDLKASNLCPCPSCRRAGELKLKLIVHLGQAVFYRVADFHKLAGPDVILVHRLLKNHVQGKEYLLLTEAAHDQMSPCQQLPVISAMESYEDMGQVRIRVHYPGLAEAAGHGQGRSPSLFRKISQTMKLMWRGLAMMSGLRQPPKFRNLS
jgi:class 3 adenylate cyclase